MLNAFITTVESPAATPGPLDQIARAGAQVIPDIGDSGSKLFNHHKLP